MQEANEHAIAGFEHSHRRINELIFRGRTLMRDTTAGSSEEDDAETQSHLLSLLVELRDELLTHLAREEEGLFPFVREHVAEMSDAVDRLAVAHDNICSAVAVLVHLVGAPERSKQAALPTAMATFERVYALHEREEREVLQRLAQRLGHREQDQLRELVRSL
jgi:iron-sulfur cluster repair protein YtfE (RIC family)